MTNNFLLLEVSFCVWWPVFPCDDASAEIGVCFKVKSCSNNMAAFLFICGNGCHNSRTKVQSGDSSATKMVFRRQQFESGTSGDIESSCW